MIGDSDAPAAAADAAKPQAASHPKMEIASSSPIAERPGLRIVCPSRVRVPLWILSECLGALERAEVPRMSVPRKLRWSGIGVNEHAAHGIQYLRRCTNSMFRN